MGQFEEACESFILCSSINHSHPYVTNNLAYIYILQGKDEEAVQVCKQAYSQNKVANNYFRNWALALLNLKKYSKAVEAIKRAIEVDNTNSSTD